MTFAWLAFFDAILAIAMIAADEVAAWFADIDRAVAGGSFLFVLPQFVVRGTRNQAPGR